jgi:cation:H+ antiporter
VRSLLRVERAGSSHFFLVRFDNGRGAFVAPLVLAVLVGIGMLIVSTDQFVTGASRVAERLNVSSVLVGAVILGCGTGLPELALAFDGSHRSPWRVLFHLEGEGGKSLGLAALIIVLAVIMTIPAFFPDRISRHSPLVLVTTISFAALLRGSIDRFEGFAMLVGFFFGVMWIVRKDRREEFDPFAPIIEDDYDHHGAYIQAPVMTPVQVELTRSMLGLLGTAVGAQLLGWGAVALLQRQGVSGDLQGVVFVGLGSLLPHVVVALQALRQHHEGLAVGNLIGSNLFQSLAIGGLVAIIRPYQSGGHLGLVSIGVMVAVGVLTGMLLRTQEELSPRRSIVLMGAYVCLVVLTVA